MDPTSSLVLKGISILLRQLLSLGACHHALAHHKACLAYPIFMDLKRFFGAGKMRPSLNEFTVI